MKKFQAYLLIAVVAIFCLASGTVAQTVQGVITGTVTDPSGASVPNATVTITNAGTSISQTTTTGSDGSYRFSLVPPGQYTIGVKAASFAEVRASGLVVEASQIVPYSVKLELAKGSEVIEVTEQAVLVQTASSDLSFQVDRSTIENTPLVDRDVFASLPFLAAQVTPGIDLAPTSGGARESGTSYLLNGADDNDNFSGGGINIHPPLESVQDFSVLTNSMSAEYGRGFGAVVTANQKSGGNRIHGVLYEFNRNATLNAADFFSNRDGNAKPKYIKNQFGGEVDGPIKKDKSFFSFAYDRIKLLSGSTSANNYVPTTAALAYMKANGGPIAQAVLSAFPPLTSDAKCTGNDNTWSGAQGATDFTTGMGTETFTGLPNSVGCISFFDPQTDTENTYYGRFDQNFSVNDRLSVTANFYRQAFVDKFGGGYLTSPTPISGDTINHYQNITLLETHTFNPRVANEFLLSHNRHFSNYVAGNPNQTNPEIIVDNAQAGCLGYGFGPFEGSQVQGFTQDRWQTRDDVSISKGRHSLKIGGGGQYGILYRNWDLGGPGYYEFAEPYNLNNAVTPASGVCPAGAQLTATCDGSQQPDGSIAGITSYYNSNFVNEYPYYQELSINPQTGAKADAYRHYTYHDYYLFMQDDWKVSSKLTLNLGLRWDRYGAPSEANGIMAQFINLGCNILEASCLAGLRMGPVARMWPTRNHDFGPRFGFAWDPTGKGKLAIRGGMGIYYDRIFDNIWSNSAWNPPFYGLLDSDASATGAVFYSNPPSVGATYVPGSIPNANYSLSLRSMDQNMKDASGQNYYFSVERQVLSSFLFRAAYQGSLGRHLPMLENLNRVDGSAANSGLTFVKPNPLYNGFNYRADAVNSSYNAMVLEAQKKMSHGLSYTVGYTWSKLLDLNSELFAACSTIGSYNAPYYFVDNAQPKLYRGPASYDHKQAFKFNVIYQEPLFKDGKGILGHVLGGWTISSFFQYYAGHPIDVYSSRTRKLATTTTQIIPDGGTLSNGATCKSAAGCPNVVLDPNGLPYNIGGDYNLDGTSNDHPDYIGGSINAAYSGANPSEGIFKDNSEIGNCGAGIPAIVTNCGGPGNSLFVNPAYPSSGLQYDRYGTLGRGVFHGPGFAQMDAGLSKSFVLREGLKLEFKAQAENVLNHPSFDCVQSNLNSGNFGKALCLTQSVQGLGAPIARVMSLGLRLSF